VEPDTSLKRVFFMRNNSDTYSGTVDSITAYDLNTFLPVTVLPMGSSPSQSGNTDPNAGTNAVDLVRWGQDGFAALTTDGKLYLVRGAAIVPALLTQNSAAVINASSVSAVAHGSGNTLLTLTGSNFLPGVAVTWNGSYRTTKIIDATHVSVAIPASDLAQPGSATITAINPGAASSASLTISIN
jgi:trimeric autotransporter adhesin